MNGQVKLWVTEHNTWCLEHVYVRNQLRWVVSRKVGHGWVKLGSWVRWSTAIDNIAAYENSES